MDDHLHPRVCVELDIIQRQFHIEAKQRHMTCLDCQVRVLHSEQGFGVLLRPRAAPLYIYKKKKKT